MRPDRLTPTAAAAAPARDRPPLISVAIPTFRRPAMLERAIASVAAQTLGDWEIVVSDDERGRGETWALLRRLRDEVPRLRAFRNRLAPGQTGNRNTALLRARGTWIKLLDDDDRLRPDCLEVLAGLAAEYPEVASISCSCDVVTPAGVRPYRRGRWALLERVPAAEIVPAMYLLEDLGGTRPTARLVSRRVVRAGTLFEELDGLRIATDSWFNTRVAAHGDLLILRRSLVEYHTGHPAVMTAVPATLLDDEFAALRRHMRGLVPGGRRLPSPAAMAGAVQILGALARLRRGRPAEALALLARVRSPRALAPLARWALHCLTAGRYSQVRRQRLDPADT